jgi:hypothetical protein
VREACDVVYTLLVDDLRERVLADRTIIAVFVAAGGKELEMPDLDKELERLDDYLSGSLEGERDEPERSALLKALGLKE